MTTPRIVYCVEKRCQRFLAAAGPLDDPTFVCRAFPTGIPEDVLAGRNDHTQPIDGDGGLRYEPPGKETD